MPPQDMTNKLATLMARQKKSIEMGSPCPYFDISDFVPDWCGTKHPSDTKRVLSFSAWTAGFQDFALAAAATEMWSYVASYTHLRHCMRIACEASSEGKTWHLAVACDRIARKAWAERALRGASTYFHMRAATVLHSCISSFKATQTFTLTECLSTVMKMRSIEPDWSIAHQTIPCQVRFNFCDQLYLMCGMHSGQVKGDLKKISQTDVTCSTQEIGHRSKTKVMARATIKVRAKEGSAPGAAILMKSWTGQQRQGTSIALLCLHAASPLSSCCRKVSGETPSIAKEIQDLKSLLKFSKSPE